MASLKDVIYISNEDYETLVSTGTVTIDGVTLTYDENNVYITPDKLASATEDGLMSAADKTSLDTIKSAYLKNATVANNTLTITKQDDTTVTFQGGGTDTNQTVKTSSVTFGSDDAVEFVGGGNVTITGNATNKTMTLGVATGYSIPSTTDQTAWTNKQDALSTQTAYTAKGSAIKVPQITTNTLGQVTGITEVNIVDQVITLTGFTLNSQTGYYEASGTLTTDQLALVNNNNVLFAVTIDNAIHYFKLGASDSTSKSYAINEVSTSSSTVADLTGVISVTLSSGAWVGSYKESYVSISDTWRAVQVDSSLKLGTATSTGPLNFVSQNTNNGDVSFTYDSGLKATAKIPTSLKNPNKLNIKVNSESSNFVEYDGSATKTITVKPSTTAGAFIINDGTTDKTIQLAGTFTDNDHYPTTFTWTNGTTSGPTGSLTGNSGFTAVSFGAIPSASSNQSGIVTINNQNFAGIKTFDNQIVSNNGITGSKTASSQPTATYTLVASIPTNTGIPIAYLKLESGDTAMTYGTSSIKKNTSSSTAYTYSFPNTTGTLALTSDFSASTTGTATTEAKYITINGTEWKLGGGSVNDVRINNVSILSSGIANILTKTAYNSSTNKIVTESDLPQIIDLR